MAEVVDEYFLSQPQPPAGLAQAQAIVVILVAADAEAFVQKPDLLIGLRPHGHAEADKAVHGAYAAAMPHGPGYSEGMEMPDIIRDIPVLIGIGGLIGAGAHRAHSGILFQT